MSTRCNIIIKDKYSYVILYRHSDGYPEGVKPTLDKFLEWVNSGKIRKCASQASGWLVLLGIQEYAAHERYNLETQNWEKPEDILLKDFSPNSRDPWNGWKIGAYEPCTEIYGDIEYLYIIDLDSKDKVTLKAHKSENIFKSVTNKLGIKYHI